MTIRRTVAASLLAAAASGASAQSPVVDAAEAGRRLYVMACQRCHGIELATHGIGFDLRTFPADDKARFMRSVAEGKNGMPAWGGTLAPPQIEQIWAYVGKVNGWPAASAAAR